VIPDFAPDYGFMDSTETEKALRELVGNSMNEDVQVEVDMEDAIVTGFRDGIRLLPHQILGRKWMKDREDVSKKCTGGILADDMGYVPEGQCLHEMNISDTRLFKFSLGKTIQTLTRIVEGAASKSDKQDGWSGCTLCVTFQLWCSRY